MKREKKTKKLSTLKKVLLSAVAVFLALVIALFSYVAADMHRSAKEAKSKPQSEQQEQYIEFEKSDLKTPVSGKVTKTPLPDVTHSSALLKVLQDHPGFTQAQYYELDAALKKEKASPVQCETDLSVLDAQQNVDADKLYAKVLQNNASVKDEKGNNKLNYFLTDAKTAEIKEICTLIADTVNSSKEDRDIRETASVLARLKIFRHETSSNLAAVTEKCVLYFNPNMMSMNEIIRSIGRKQDKKYDDKVLTFVHEIEHLKQFASSDSDYENGMEAGAFRDYSDLKVNSLWDQWLLEASAEIKMTEYLQTDPMVYAKKISYVKSCNLAGIFDESVPFNALINSTFDNDLNAMFKRLKLKDKKSQRDFLELLYSIQLGQYDCNDFWENYEAKTGKKMNEEARFAFKMDVREEVIYHLSEQYYKTLLDAVDSGVIRDEETLFYMLRLWEMDCCGHLAYTKKDALPHAKAYLRWHSKVNDALFSMLADAGGRSKEKIQKAYNAYHPLINSNGKTVHNYRFYGLSEEKEAYIDACFNGYSMTFFTEMEKMDSYLK